eukprot:scaffold5815_cov75-Skeletonema_marinoi.AAC.3
MCGEVGWRAGVMASTSGSYQSTMSSEHEPEVVASAAYQHANADNKYDFKTNKSDDWVDGEEGGDEPLKPQTPTIDDRATTQTTIPITKSPHAATTSIYKKRLLKGETSEDFYTFINAAFLAMRKGDFEEVDRLAKIRIQKRRRQHSRAQYYAKKKDRAKAKASTVGRGPTDTASAETATAIPVRSIDTSATIQDTPESELLNNNFNEQQPHHPQQKLLPLLPEIVTSAVYHVDTDDEDFKTSSQSAVMDYEADTDCEDFAASPVEDEGINECGLNNREESRCVPSEKRKQPPLEEEHRPRRRSTRKRRKRKKGSADGCTHADISVNIAQKGGECTKHGAERKQSSEEGCQNVLVKGEGAGKRHGARVKQCSRKGCTNQVVKGGVCKRHGAEGKRCSNREVCEEAENTNTGRSVSTKKRKQSSLEDDDRPPERAAKKRLNRKKCSADGCKNQAQKGGVCIKHGAK